MCTSRTQVKQTKPAPLFEIKSSSKTQVHGCELCKKGGKNFENTNQDENEKRRFAQSWFLDSRAQLTLIIGSSFICEFC